MIVVMQCAASKQAAAGYLRTRDGRRVMFVAQPQLAPPSDEFHYARPDDPSGTDESWRDVITRYSADPRGIPLAFCQRRSFTHIRSMRVSQRA